MMTCIFCSPWSDPHLFHFMKKKLYTSKIEGKSKNRLVLPYGLNIMVHNQEFRNFSQEKANQPAVGRLELIPADEGYP